VEKEVKIIAFTGAKGCGKDTVAEMIQRQCDAEQQHYRQIAFADPIKQKIQFLFNLDCTYQYDLFKRTDVTYTIGTQTKTMTGRHLVREIGMMMREYDSGQFIKYVREQFSDPINQTEEVLYLVTDMRFDNEYIMLRSHGATVVKVSRPGCEYDGHITERGFDDRLVDYHIQNDGSLEDLQTAVTKMLNEIRNNP
jgi:energy-coupling factor transporter ATP-binding protein EcfA2